MNVTSIVVGNAQVQLLDDGDAIVRMTNNRKLWEPDTRGYWRNLVKRETVVVDIGAYTGIYSIASAMMGAKVIAFEPHPANFQRLKLNAAINSVRIKAIRCAVSDKQGVTSLNLKHGEERISDIGSLVFQPDVLTCGIAVDTCKLDNVTFTKPVSLIKIDTEGHEPAVLAGALQTIQSHKPSVVVEVLTPSIARAVDDIMRMIDYSLVKVLDKRNRLYQWRSRSSQSSA